MMYDDTEVLQAGCQNTILQRLISAAPESALALHLQGRMKCEEVKEDAAGTLCCLRKHSMKSVVVATMRLVVPPPTSVDDFYWSRVAVSPVASAELCQTTRYQKGHQWISARRVRITASEAHAWYTYEGEAWQGKVERHLMSRFAGTAATRYGQDNETAALLAYEKQQGERVMRCGLVVPPGAAWLGCSPDGVVCDEGGMPIKLLEIKCPLMGKEHTSLEMAVTPPPFLQASGENVELRRKNRYFSQVQLSMAILNVNACDLAVYSKVDDSVLVVRVPRDRVYGRNLIAKLHEVYFKHILPQLKGGLAR